jgi:hypothetical protein
MDKRRFKKNQKKEKIRKDQKNKEKGENGGLQPKVNFSS